MVAVVTVVVGLVLGILVNVAMELILVPEPFSYAPISTLVPEGFGLVAKIISSDGIGIFCPPIEMEFVPAPAQVALPIE